MTRLGIENSLTAVNQVVLNGEPLVAFEKYYHDEVAMQENNELSGKIIHEQFIHSK